MVMTVSNIHRMLESSEVEGRGAVVAVRSTNSSAARLPKEGEGGGATLEKDSTLGHLEVAHI